jgi:hypothetical protein
MAGLSPQAARSAAADVDVVADGQRVGLGEILDMLGGDSLQDQLAPQPGAAARQPDGDHLVDMLRWLPVRVPAVGRARLAPGKFGVGRAVVPGERGGLVALGGPAQRLHLAQALAGLPQPPGQPGPGRRPNPPPPLTQDPEATTSPPTVNGPLAHPPVGGCAQRRAWRPRSSGQRKHEERLEGWRSGHAGARRSALLARRTNEAATPPSRKVLARLESLSYAF